MQPEPYPLSWPAHWPRTKYRTDSKFGKKPFSQIRDGLMAELRRLNVKKPVLTSDVPVRGDGLPYARASAPDDPGVAVYFSWKGQPFTVACDTYRRVWENVHALAKTIEAMRAIQRHGASQLLERALSGYKALPGGEGEPAPEPERPWWVVIDLCGEDSIVDEETLRKVIANPDSPYRTGVLKLAETLYKQKTQKMHPDRGGDPGAFAELNLAMETARKQLGVRT